MALFNNLDLAALMGAIGSLLLAWEPVSTLFSRRRFSRILRIRGIPLLEKIDEEIEREFIRESLTFKGVGPWMTLLGALLLMSSLLMIAFR